MTLWALFYLLSFVLFVILSTALVKAKKLDIKFRNLYTIVYLAGMVFGAHALYFAFCEHTLASPWLQAYYAAWPDRETGWLADLWGLRAVTVGSGGMWGGPWFVLLTLLPMVLLLRLDLPGKYDLLDVFAVSLAFPLALAKVGCFVNGCCYGRQWRTRSRSMHFGSCFCFSRRLSSTDLGTLSSRTVRTYPHLWRQAPRTQATRKSSTSTYLEEVQQWLHRFRANSSSCTPNCARPTFPTPWIRWASWTARR